MPETTTRTRPVRKALLAGTAAAVLFGGGAAAGLFLPPPGDAQAQQVEVPRTEVPFDFSDLAEAVSPAVVSISVEGRMDRPDGAERRGGRGGDGGDGGGQFEIPGLGELPEDHPLYRFFREYGLPFGERDRGQERAEPRTPRTPRMAQGSGFLISEDGYVVTNNHVVSGGGIVQVVMNDGSEYTAELIGTDEQTDLALLRIESDDSFPYVSFSGDEIRVGSWVVAVGNPFGLGGTVTAGIISGHNREIGAGPYDDFIQIDAPVNRGNSGGPAFNLNGEVVGVNTAIFSPSGGNVGIAFAIPAAVAVPVIEQLMDTGSVSRGWLGVQIQPVNEDIAESLGLDRAEGALIADILDSGPARESDLRRGDVVLSVDGDPVRDSRDLARRIGNLNPDAEATLEVWRNGDVMDVTLQLGTQPPRDEMAAAPPAEPDEPAEPDADTRLGMSMAPASTMGAEDGVAVVDVEPDGEAARKGLRVGDVILEAGGEPVSTPDDVRAAVERAEEANRRAVLLRVQSEQGERFVALSIAQA